MKHARIARKKNLLSEINVVPYIDVMLVLLVIFMVTAPLFTQGVKIDLPQAAAETMQSGEREPFVLTVDADGNYYLNDHETKVVNAREVEIKARAVLRRHPDLPFLLRGDKAANYADVVRGMTLLQKAGVDSVGLVTQPEL